MTNPEVEKDASELTLFEDEYRAIAQTIHSKLDKQIVRFSIPVAISMLAGVVHALTGLPDPLIEPAIVFSTGTALTAVGVAVVRKVKNKETSNTKKSLSLAYNLELGAILYERHGIALKGKANPEGTALFGYDSVDMVYAGNMNKAGHDFRGAIYNTPQGIAYATIDKEGNMSSQIY